MRLIVLERNRFGNLHGLSSNAARRIGRNSDSVLRRMIEPRVRRNTAIAYCATRATPSDVGRCQRERIFDVVKRVNELL
jgi:hypothetical protein